MSRKPYIAKQPDDWYMKSRFLRLYMLRELTSVPVAIAALNLFVGIVALAGSPDAWISWVVAQRNPVLIIFNLLAVAAALFNSKTWFEAVPKAMPIQKGEKFVPAQVLIRASWGVLAGIFAVLLIIVIALA